MNTPNLTIDGIRVNYIFSYFVGATKRTSDQKTERIILKWNVKKDGYDIKDKLVQVINDRDIYKSFDYHESEEFEPLNVRSGIYFHFPHFSISKTFKNVLISFPFHKNKINGKIQVHLALFETGMGLMWASIQFNNSLSCDELHKINQRKNVPHIILEDDDKGVKIPIHELFKKEIEQLVYNINLVFREFFPEYEYYLDSKFWQDNSNAYSRGNQILQEPSIAILIKSKQYLELFEKQDLSFQLFLSSILHGVDTDSIDQHHAKEHTGNNCINLYPTKKFLTGMHGNCLLVFHNEEYDNNTSKIEEYNTFKEFTYGLFRTYCAVRGTWHIYKITINRLKQKVDLLVIENANYNSKSP